MMLCRRYKCLLWSGRFSSPANSFATASSLMLDGSPGSSTSGGTSADHALFVQAELEVYRALDSDIPELSEQRFKRLLECETREQRVKYLCQIAQRRITLSKKPTKMLPYLHNDHIRENRYGLWCKGIFLRINLSSMNRIRTIRAAQHFTLLSEVPKFAVDLSYLNDADMELSRPWASAGMGIFFLARANMLAQYPGILTLVGCKRAVWQRLQEYQQLKEIRINRILQHDPESLQTKYHPSELVFIVPRIFRKAKELKTVNHDQTYVLPCNPRIEDYTRMYELALRIGAEARYIPFDRHMNWNICYPKSHVGVSVLLRLLTDVSVYGGWSKAFMQHLPTYITQGLSNEEREKKRNKKILQEERIANLLNALE